MKTFYQCDVADSETDSIWTGSIHYTETPEEAEFLTMLELQQDWGDGYMPDSFLDAFGSEPTLEALQEREDPQFPGVEAWNAAGYWSDIPATTGMLTLPPLEALAQLKKINFDVPGDVVDAAIAGEAQLHVVVDMSVPRTPGKIIANIDGKVTMPAHVWDDVTEALADNLVAWQGEENSVKDEHAELIDRLENLGFYLAAHSGSSEKATDDPPQVSARRARLHPQGRQDEDRRQRRARLRPRAQVCAQERRHRHARRRLARR
jgi:hypothetical protein